MAERLNAGPTVARTGQACGRAPGAVTREEPDEITRSRFEHDLREAQPQDVAVFTDAPKPSEEGASASSSASAGAYVAMLPGMALPIPATIPGQAPALLPERSPVFREPVPSPLPNPKATPGSLFHTAEDIRLAVVLCAQSEGLDGEPVTAALRGPGELDARKSEVKGVRVAQSPSPSPSPSVPLFIHPVAREQMIVSAPEATSDAPTPADTRRVNGHASEVPSAGWGGQPATAFVPPGAPTQEAEVTGPRVLPDQVIEEAVARMMVGVDHNGAKQLRVELRSDWMPGVQMVLQEAGGRVQIDLICSVEASRQRLGAISSREIGDIARRCRRDLLVRVQSEESADSEDSGGWHEVLGVA